MASIISATTTNGLSTSADNSGSLQLATNNGTTALTIDSSQNVGVGTASPQARLHQSSTNDGVQAIFTGAQTGTTQTILLRSQYQTNNGTAGFANIGWFDNGSQGGGLTFGTTSNGGGTTGTPTERMRINSAGNVCIGTTSDIARIGAVFDGNTNNGCVLRTSTNASGTGFLYFQQDTNTCGSVIRVGTTSAVTYSSTSDYRLKENIVPMTNGLDKVSRLKPVTYTWKQGGESAEGFIAHELAEVCPDAVVGTKDQMETYIDEDGNEQTRPKYQSIDTSFLVATLTAAIQELKAELDATKAEVQALKGVA